MLLTTRCGPHSPSATRVLALSRPLPRPQVLWPYDGVATRGSDTVQAPSQHLIHLMGGPSGRSHRLCLEAGSTSAHLDEWLRLLSVPPDGGGGGGGGGGRRRRDGGEMVTSARPTMG